MECFEARTMSAYADEGCWWVVGARVPMDGFVSFHVKAWVDWVYVSPANRLTLDPGKAERFDESGAPLALKLNRARLLWPSAEWSAGLYVVERGYCCQERKPRSR